MSDLISRQALERRCKGSYLTPDDFRFEIRNAPAIEQGEAVAWSQFDDEGEEVMTWHRFDCIPTSVRESVIPLYLAPQQPQSVADALEEAAKICDDEAEGFYQRSGSLDYETNALEFSNEHAREAYDLCKELAEQIRALIKRNAKVVE